MITELTQEQLKLLKLFLVSGGPTIRAILKYNDKEILRCEGSMDAAIESYKYNKLPYEEKHVVHNSN